MMGKNYSMTDLVAAKIALMGKNKLVYGMNHPAPTKKAALEYAIKQLQGILEASNQMDDESEFGYQITVELIEKKQSDEERLREL